MELGGLGYLTHDSCWNHASSRRQAGTKIEWQNVEKIHSVCTINNLNTSYPVLYTTEVCYLMTTFRCPSDILTTSWLFKIQWQDVSNLFTSTRLMMVMMMLMLMTTITMTVLHRLTVLLLIFSDFWRSFRRFFLVYYNFINTTSEHCMPLMKLSININLL